MTSGAFRCHLTIKVVQSGGLYDLQGSGAPSDNVVAGPGSTYRDVQSGDLYIMRQSESGMAWKRVQA